MVMLEICIFKMFACRKIKAKNKTDSKRDDRGLLSVTETSQLSCLSMAGIILLFSATEESLYASMVANKCFEYTCPGGWGLTLIF